MSADSYFEHAGDAIVPTEHCASPWSTEASAGGPVAGLIAYTARGAVDADGLVLARLAVDLVNPVPIAPIHVQAHSVVDRRRLKLVRLAVATTDGLPLVEGTAQFLAPSAIDYGLAMAELPRLPPPEDCPLGDFSAYGRFIDDLEMRVARPFGTAQSGRLSATWSRASRPLFPDVPLTPELRAAIESDHGFRSLVTTEGLGYVNTDFTSYFQRAPRGEWIAIDGWVRMVGDGMAIGGSYLRDIDGPFATSTSSCLAQRQAAGGG